MYRFLMGNNSSVFQGSVFSIKKNSKKPIFNADEHPYLN